VLGAFFGVLEEDASLLLRKGSPSVDVDTYPETVESYQAPGLMCWLCAAGGYDGVGYESG
jgi:hypothetical protein